MIKSKKSVGSADISTLKLISQTLSEEEVIKHIQKFYENCGDIIVRKGGKILNYYGDEMIFIFDKAKDAYAASKEMSQYYLNNLSLNGSKLKTAIVTGEIYTGEIGHKSLKLFSAFGYIMNKIYALQKEAQEKPDGIAYCEETKKEI